MLSSGRVNFIARWGTLQLLSMRFFHFPYIFTCRFFSVLFSFFLPPNRQVSLCVKDGEGPLPLPTLDLESGWGIDRFPCSRLTPLDCFQEGNYDCKLTCVFHTMSTIVRALCILSAVEPVTSSTRCTGECHDRNMQLRSFCLVRMLRAVLLVRSRSDEATGCSVHVRGIQQRY